MSESQIDRMQQLDAIANLFEAAWISGQQFIEAFLEDHPIDLPRLDVLKVLIPLEIEFRLNWGDQEIDAAEYADRFEGINKTWVEGVFSGKTIKGKIPRSDEATLPSKRKTESEDVTLAPTKTHPQFTGEPGSLENLGDYEIIEEIARGGMGVVYKARQKSLNRVVALKMILSGDFAGEEEIKRFKSEAEAAANLDHPGIVPIYEIGEHDGHPFFSMGFVKGASLSSFTKDGPMRPKAAAEMAKKIAEAIAFAHEHGVIHRDLKPANVLIDAKGQPRVTDFGLAKKLEGDSNLTGTGQILGTPSYMPPEQASGETTKVDERADVYSLGAILYFLLVNRPPFQAATPMDTLMQVLEKEPVSLRNLDSEVPKDLETICLKCLRKESSKRYSTALEFAEDLGRWLNHEPIVARRVSQIEKTRLWCKRRPVVVSSISATLMVVLLSIAVITWQWLRSDAIAVESAVDALQFGNGKEIPSVLERFDSLPSEKVLERLKESFPEANGQQKLSLAYGLAHFGEMDLDAIISGLANPNTKSEEAANIVRALNQGDPDLAVKQLRVSSAKATKSKDWKAKVRFAVVAMYLGDDSIAAEMLRAQPDQIEPQKGFPDLLLAFEKQIEQISRMPKDERESPEMRLQLAEACLYLDRNREAHEVLENLSSGDQVSPKVWLLLAQCLAREAREVEAQAALEKLASSTHNKSDASFGRILVLAWSGNFEEANIQLEKLVSDSPTDSNTHYHAACIAAQLARICRVKKVAGWEWWEAGFAERAVKLLAKAYNDLGYRATTRADHDPNLIPLHENMKFRSLITELFVPKNAFDPIQRTVFISEFRNWAFDLDTLTKSIPSIVDPHFRSGMCLALGGVGAYRPAKDAWRSTLIKWYAESPDSGTHSAAGWAMNQWRLRYPKTPTPDTPTNDLDWWHTSNGLRFVKIKAGNVVGENGLVIVKDDYWLCDSEVTVLLFKRFMADQEYHAKNLELKPERRVFKNDLPHHPVKLVSWYDAILFCNWLSDELGLDPCYQISKSKEPREYDVRWLREANGIRLPTGPEWEYACRASTTTRFSFGDDESKLAEYGWFDGNSQSRTHSGREKRCNTFGLFDMHGNVDEWCWNLNSIHTIRARVFRGGSWYDQARSCRSSSRDNFEPNYVRNSLGFRVAKGHRAGQASQGKKQPE